MTNKPSPDSSLPDFNHSAEMPETTRIANELHKLGDRKYIHRHKELVASQEAKLKTTIADLKERHEGAVELWQTQFLNESAKSVHPALKPSDFHRTERKSRDKAAYDRALVHVRQIERTHIIEIKVTFVVEQKEILTCARSATANKEFCNAAAKAIRQSFDQAQSRGRGLCKRVKDHRLSRSPAVYQHGNGAMTMEAVFMSPFRYWLLQHLLMMPLVTLWKVAAALLLIDGLLTWLRVDSAFLYIRVDRSDVWLSLAALWGVYQVETISRCGLSKFVIGKTLRIQIKGCVLRIGGWLTGKRYALEDNLTFGVQALQNSADPIYQHSSRIDLIVGQVSRITIAEVIDHQTAAVIVEPVPEAGDFQISRFFTVQNCI